jgi:hypothetical protein
LNALLENYGQLLLWGLLATVVMTTVLQASQGLGLSRLSLPFLVGTMLTARRGRANVLGFVMYALGGWVFEVIYLAFFIAIRHGNWWIGLLFGVAHGVVLLVAVLPLISYIHPRMANEYDGPTHTQRLEPPGFVGLNYGYRTPLSVVVAQAAYGVVIGLCFQLVRQLPT